MDNNNQHDDLDGLHPPPPPNDLPPLWEDIAGALDAANTVDAQPEEEMADTNAPHEQAVADFSVIKAGFVVTFGQQEPPKFLWDTIEQDLEAQVTTDAPTEFSSIKDSFLAAFGEQQPPQSFWQELSERVDQPIEELPKEETASYSQIKHSFERKYSAIVVPLFSWDDLVARMETETIAADTPDRFSCIKESFETVYARQEPSAATTAGLWRRLYPLATGAQRFGRSEWSKRVGVAVLLLLGWSIWSNQPLDTTALTEEPVADNAWTKSTSRITDSFDKTRVGQNEEFLFLTEEERANRDASAEAALATNNPYTERLTVDLWSSSLEARLLLLPPAPLEKTTTNALPAMESAASTQASPNRYSTSTKTTSLASVETTATSTDLSKTGIKKAKKERENTRLYSKTSQGTGNGGDGTNNGSATPVTAPKESPNAKKEGTIKALDSKQRSLALSLAPLFEPLSEQWSVDFSTSTTTAYGPNFIPDPAVIALQNPEFPEVRRTVKGKKMHFELGVEGRLGTSVMLARNDNEAVAREVMLCPTGAVGINFQYYFGSNDALVVAAQPYSSTIQCWGEEAGTAGGYQETAMRLSFMDFSVGYQRILLRYNGYSEAPASIYARLSLGVGVLTNSETHINQQQISTSNLYRDLNWNAGLSIGNLHQMQRFVLDYGLMGNIGLNNFITEAQPNVLQPARIVNVGAYVGLRYLFMPRNAPTKKQRQFDWSAPFFIEEPKF